MGSAPGAADAQAVAALGAQPPFPMSLGPQDAGGDDGEDSMGRSDAEEDEEDDEFGEDDAGGGGRRKRRAGASGVGAGGAPERSGNQLKRRREQVR